MGALKEIKINRFDGGITNDIREKSANKCAFVSHFKIAPRTLTQNRDWQAWTNDSEYITRFIHVSDNNEVYGLGRDGAANNYPRVYTNGSIGGKSWTTVATGSTGARATNVFFYYKSYIYMWQNGTVLSQLNVSTDALTEAYQSISYTNVAQPVHHPADDIAYFFSDNKVHSLNDTTWSTADLTLPTNLKIVGAAPYGNYLAIACSPTVKGTANSVLFLWDRDSSITTISDKIDLGIGQVKDIVSIEDGGFYIIQDASRNTSLFNNEQSLQVKYYNGGFITKDIKFGDSLVDYFLDFKMYGNAISNGNKIYFPVEILTSLSGEYHGIVSAELINGEIIVVLDMEVSSVASSKNIDGLGNVEGTLFTAHSNTTTLSEGNTTASTAIYEGFVLSDHETTMQLVGATVTHKKLPTAGSVALKYRTDIGSNWTTIFTNTTDNSVRHSARNIESSGAKLPQSNELQFRIEATGGACITGLKFRYEEIEDDVY